MAETMVNVRECVMEEGELIPLLARAFLYAEGDARVALARALLTMMY